MSYGTTLTTATAAVFLLTCAGLLLAGGLGRIRDLPTRGLVTLGAVLAFSAVCAAAVLHVAGWR